MLRRFQLLAQRGFGHPNLQAVGVALSTMAAVYLNTDPLPAGSEPQAIAETELACASSTLVPRLTMPSLISRPAPPAPLSDGIEPVLAPLSESAAAVTPAAASAAPSLLTGKWAMQMNVVILQKGLAEFSRVPDYTATFIKRERIGGDLSDEQQISLKVRQSPFSVYMKWRSGSEIGQQVIYVAGQNDGNMLVKPGGFKGRLLKNPLSIDPSGSMAMGQARYPVTMVGLTAMAERIVKYQQSQIDRGQGFACEFRDDVEFDGRACYRCVVVYDSQDSSPDYRKSEILIDRKLSMPIFVQNYTWSRDPNPDSLDEETLIEQYTYSDLQLTQQLADRDFDRTNEEYRMVR